MSDDLTHDEVESLLGAYTLDAVPGERESVASHLEDCPRCRAELDAFSEVASALGNSVAPVPPELWDRIAGRLDLSSPGEDTLLEIRAKVRTQAAGRDARGLVAGARLARWRRAAMVTVAAAAAVALALVSLSLSNAKGTVGHLQALVVARGAGAAARSALAEPGHQLAQLRAPGGGQLVSVVVAPSGTGYLLATRLAPLPSTKTYQLWASIDSRPVSLGLLGSRPLPDAAFSLRSSARASELLVTVEPARGVVSPTASPVAEGGLET